MAGILAIWNDCAPEGEAHYERWYKSEHMQERVGVAGFRFGRRYERSSGGDRRFFTFYEVESPDVLSSRAYVERLENPTPWTTESMKYFRNMVRTVCDLRAAAGRAAPAPPSCGCACRRRARRRTPARSDRCGR